MLCAVQCATGEVLAERAISKELLALNASKKKDRNQKVDYPKDIYDHLEERREIRKEMFQLSSEEEAEEKEYTNAMEVYHQNLMKAESKQIDLAWGKNNNHEAWHLSPINEGISSSKDSDNESEEERDEEKPGRLLREGRRRHKNKNMCDNVANDDYAYELIKYRSQPPSYEDNW